MPHHDIIVVGASAGGVEALSELVRGLPADLPAAVFVVLHVSPHGPSAMPAILSRSGPLPACHAEDGESVKPGKIYIAPPDHHILLARGKVVLSRGPRENGHRPAVDPLFRSAALAYGPRVIGVVLTGALDDGTAGLLTIKSHGGVAVAQDPEDAFHPSMPRNAVETVDVDHVLPLALIPPLLTEVVNQEVADVDPPANENDLAIEIGMAEMDKELLIKKDEHPGVPSAFTCPECHGALFELHEGELVRFRCRVGHAYSANSLLAAQSESLEIALWTAMRALEEKASLAHRVAYRARSRERAQVAESFEQQAKEAEESADLIRRVLMKGPGVGRMDPTEDYVT